MSKLKAKNILYNDPRYDVVVDSRMLEQHLKEKDQQISNIETKLAESEKKASENHQEEYELYLKLKQFYSRLGVEAYADDEVQDVAVKELNRLLNENDKLKQQLADMTKKYELASLPVGGLVDTARNLEKQLKAQPAEIINKIKKEFQKHLIDWYEDEENTNKELYIDSDWVWEVLDTILKEYGEKDE